MGAYHPTIAPRRAIHHPPCDLPRGLDHEQGTEALAQLKHGRGPSQCLIPRAQRHALDQPARAQKPPAPRRIRRRLRVAPSPRRPAGDARTLGLRAEAAHRPQQQGRNNEPLRQRDDAHQQAAETRIVGRGDAEDGVEEVKGREGQRVREPAGAAADVERKRDGEDDGGEKDDGAGDAREPHRRGKRRAPPTGEEVGRGRSAWQSESRVTGWRCLSRTVAVVSGQRETRFHLFSCSRLVDLVSCTTAKTRRRAGMVMSSTDPVGIQR